MSNCLGFIDRHPGVHWFIKNVPEDFWVAIFCWCQNATKQIVIMCIFDLFTSINRNYFKYITSLILHRKWKWIACWTFYSTSSKSTHVKLLPLVLFVKDVLYQILFMNCIICKEFPSLAEVHPAVKIVQVPFCSHFHSILLIS